MSVQEFIAGANLKVIGELVTIDAADVCLECGSAGELNDESIGGGETKALYVVTLKFFNIYFDICTKFLSLVNEFITNLLKVTAVLNKTNVLAVCNNAEVNFVNYPGVCNVAVKSLSGILSSSS